jgi:hypothetical protein
MFNTHQSVLRVFFQLLKAGYNAHNISFIFLHIYEWHDVLQTQPHFSVSAINMNTLWLKLPFFVYYDGI